MRLHHIVIATAACLSLNAFAQSEKSSVEQRAPSSAATQSQATSSGVIRQAQEKLKAAGHDAGPADGIMSVKTQQALKDYQKAKGMEQTGLLDQRTLAALGVTASGVGATGTAPEASVGSSSRSEPREPASGKRY